MPLFGRIVVFFRWLGAVLGVFLLTHPGLTPALILSKATAQITRLLAFFLPLKVLLLVASPGVPRYFQFFIDPQYRNEWAVGLSIGAVASYLLTLLLDRFSDHCAEVGSTNLLQKSSRLSVIGNQRSIAKRYYGDFSGLAAGLLLVAVIFGVGSYIYPLLFASLAVFLCVQLLVTWAGLKFIDTVEPVGFGGYIVRRTNNYLGYLEAINFLAVFGFLVVDFLLFDGVNILIAILAFLMTRRLLASLNSVVRDAVMLARQRHRIDPLIFLTERHTKRQPGNQQKLGLYFPVSDRQGRLLEVLALSGLKGISRVRSHWLDSGPAGKYLFEIYGESEAGNVIFNGIEQVTSSRHKQVLQNEALIVEALGNSILCLSAIVQEYEVGDFQSRIYDLEGASAVTARDWKGRYQADLMLYFWGVDPGAELRGIFELSRPYLHERLTPAMLEPLEVAADTEAKVNIVASLRERLGEVCSLIGALPVFPFNRALSPNSVFVDDDHNLKVIDWGRWSLEPVGVGLEPEAMGADLVRRLESRLQVRHWDQPTPSVHQLRLAARASAFEELVLTRGRFNEALNFAKEMIEDLDSHTSDHVAGPRAHVR